MSQINAHINREGKSVHLLIRFSPIIYECIQRLQQGCIPSPLLFNTFVAALEVVLERFSKDEAILSELVHFGEEEERVEVRVEDGKGDALRR